MVTQKIGEEIPDFLKDESPEILIGISKTLENLGITEYNKDLFTTFGKSKSPEVRAQLLSALGKLGFDQLKEAARKGMGDKAQIVREAAIGLIDKLDISAENLPSVVDPIFKTGTVREQQAVLNVLGEMPLAKSNNVLQGLIKKVHANRLSDGVVLDLVEAIEATGSKKLIAQLGKIKSNDFTVEGYKETLHGGNWRAGRSVFNNNPTAQCVRCHAVNGAGGQVGPPLDDIANILTKEQILEALIQPSKRLAPGYGSVTVTLIDGQVVTGVMEEETKDELILRTNDAEPMEIAHSRIKKRENGISAMPAVGRLISKRELRDLVEYLNRLKKRKTTP